MAIFSSQYTITPAASHGVVNHLFGRNITTDFTDVAALGVSFVRVPWDDSYAVECLAALDARGISCLFVVTGFNDADHCVETMQRITTAYPGRMWQVGNEWDIGSVAWSDTGTKYADIMRRVVAACPVGTQFVHQGLASAVQISPDKPRWQAWVSSYIAASGPTLLAWAIHTYDNPPTQVSWISQRPLWITEYGSAAGDAAQIAVIQQIIGNAGSWGVARTCYYTYWDKDLPDYGLITVNGTRRPSWNTLHSLIR